MRYKLHRMEATRRFQYQRRVLWDRLTRLPNPLQARRLSTPPRIVIAQVFLLLSLIGPVKNEKDKAKWDAQTEQIRKVSTRLVCTPSL